VSHDLISLAVAPATATLAAGAAQQFAVSGQWSDGGTTAPAVTFTATGGTISGEGLYTAGGVAGSYRVIAVQQGGALADTSAVTVLAPSLAPTGDKLQISGVPPTSIWWLLKDSDTQLPGASACPSDAVTLVATTEVTISDVGLACRTQLSVFAKGAAPILDTAPGWTPDADVILENLPSRWGVELHVVGEYASTTTDAIADAVRASQLFYDNRMGIYLPSPISVSIIDPDDAGTGGLTPLAKDIKGGCTTTASNPELNAPGRLNVIYVRNGDAYWPFDATTYGKSCTDATLPNKPSLGLIFIRQEHILETLAHEVGHVLSLNHVGAGRNDLYGWPASNLMRDAIWDPTPEPPTTNPAVSTYSLGQAYRANFNQDSWLNRLGPRKGLDTNVCTDNTLGPTQPTTPHITWPCPDLQLE
jgi:hypothetical protein